MTASDGVSECTGSDGHKWTIGQTFVNSRGHIWILTWECQACPVEAEINRIEESES